MSRLLDDDLDDLPQRERELTLSTGAILAIFLGLVLLCAVFFGFGYNLGRKSTTTPNAAVPSATGDSDSAPPANSTFDNFKPSPASPTTSAANKTASTTIWTPAAAAESATPTPTHAAPANDTPTTAVTKPAPIAVHTVPATDSAAPHTVTTTTTPPPRAAQPAASSPTPGGAFVVQIAAISPAHKDDADLLATALHGKGYDVAERTATQDKLIHIQVGPFATKADAEAMRERLIVDGYNAIVK
jgi:cell division septation protein DedD